jgi:hypothetical protein
MQNPIHCVGKASRGVSVKKLVKFALIVGAIVFLAKLVAAQKAKWEGLTESEVRDKIESRLPKQVPSDKRAEIADKVVSGMREGGVLGDEDERSASAQTDGGGGEEPDSDDAEASEDTEDITSPV